MTKKEMILQILQEHKRATKRFIVNHLNEIRFEGYSNWQVFEIDSSILCLRKEGKIKPIKRVRSRELLYEVVV